MNDIVARLDRCWNSIDPKAREAALDAAMAIRTLRSDLFVAHEQCRSLAAERDTLRAERNAERNARFKSEAEFSHMQRRIARQRRALAKLYQRRHDRKAENARLREALTNAAAVIGSFYAFAETADAVSISGIARCHAMLTSMKKNRRRIEETVMTPARAALGEKE
jgi:hypothetical protein